MRSQLSDEVVFPEWVPDLGEYKTGATTVLNCLSYGGLYKPLPSLATNTDAAPDKVIGSYMMKSSDGVTHAFCGTRTKLYKLSGGTTWTEVTWSSGDYNTALDGFWSFCNYGDLVIATNYNDDPQVFDTTGDTEFSQLSSTAPKGKWVFVINDFVMLLDIDDSGQFPFRAQWGPLGNPQGDWTPSIDTQAGYYDLLGGGFVNVAGYGAQNFGIIIQDNSIWRAEYAGGDQIFSFILEEQGRGSILARATATDGTFVYYLDEDGFYRTQGRESEPIGRNKIDKWFFDNFSSTYGPSVTACVDPVNKYYAISFPSIESGSSTPDKMLFFNITDRRWTPVEQEVDMIFPALSQDYTLDSLAVPFPDLDTVPYSLDSRVWQGGRFLFGAFSSDHKFGSFNSTPYEATLGTAEIRVNQNGKVNILGLLPYVEAGTVEARIGTRNLLTEAVDYSSYRGVNSMTGEIDLVKQGRFVRADFVLSGEWDNAKGFAYRYRQAGYV